LFEGFRWFWGLTCDFWAEIEEKYLEGGVEPAIGAMEGIKENSYTSYRGWYTVYSHDRESYS
jgi:hypothetical protein